MAFPFASRYFNQDEETFVDICQQIDYNIGKRNPVFSKGGNINGKENYYHQP